METNSQHFIKIEIKGDPKNLPQNFGVYNAQYKGDDFVSKVLYYPPYSENFWLRFIEWYEIPATESIQKSEDIYYKRVDIKGESDLPEKGKRYFFHKKGTSILRLQTYCPKDDNCEVLPKYYLDDYDFYLSPVPEPQQPEQPESAIQKAIQFIKENPYQDDFVNRCYRLTNQEGGDNTIESAGYWREQFDIVIDFISQSHNNTVVGLTEEDIEKESHKVIMNHLTDKNGDFKQSTIGADDKKIWWIKGAEYALFQCKAIDLNQIEKQLLERFGFTDGVVNAESQVKIFSFIDWLKKRRANERIN